MHWFEYVLGLCKANPELSSIGFGVVMAGLIVGLLDVVYFPEAWTFRKSQQVAVGLNLLVGTAGSYGLWRFLDPTDTRWFSLWVSALCIAGSPMFLFLVSKIVSWKFPSLQLSFGLLRNRPCGESDLPK